jgi:hypothetical protein
LGEFSRLLNGPAGRFPAPLIGFLQADTVFHPGLNDQPRSSR